MLEWLARYPPEERDGGTLRAADRILSERISRIEQDYADHADRPKALAILREAFEADRIALFDMRVRVRAALAKIDHLAENHHA